MNNVEALLTEANQALSELVTMAEKNADGLHAAGIEQALAEFVGFLRKTLQYDVAGIVAAIKGLNLTVNVSPTPFEIVVPPAPATPFRPLVMKVTAYNHQGRIDTVEISERGAK